ncbi:hypothetical protein ACNKHO_15270 [Shigella flexneri]
MLNFLLNVIGRNFLPVDDNLIFFQQQCFAESDTRVLKRQNHNPTLLVTDIQKELFELTRVQPSV